MSENDNGAGQVPAGEGTPTTPPVENNQPGQTPEPGGNPSPTPEGSPEGSVPKTIPYERFKEVNDKYQELNSRWESVAPIIESLRQPQKPDEVDPSQFQSVEEYNAYMDKKMSDREKVLEQKFETKMEAERKLVELRETYPEMKTDPVFRDFVISKMHQNPGVDVMTIAKGVKDYFSQFESRGREAAKKEFLEKGGFQGKSEGNQPFAESDEDKALKNAIINAGGKKGRF